MLSFMREQNPDSSRPSEGQDSSPVTGRSPDTGNKTPVKSDDAQVTRDEKYLTVAARNKNVRKTTYLLAVLTGCGLLCLWFMIKKSAPSSAVADSKANTQPEQIETTIAQLTGVRSEMYNQMDEVVKKFYQFSDVQQVNVNELVKNPFELVGPVHDPLPLSPMGENRESAHGMRLLGIIHSDQSSCCMIRVAPELSRQSRGGGKMGPLDYEILYEGDLIGGFRVRQIGDSFVRLESEHGITGSGYEIILTVSE